MSHNPNDGNNYFHNYSGGYQHRPPIFGPRMRMQYPQASSSYFMPQYVDTRPPAETEVGSEFRQLFSKSDTPSTGPPPLQSPPPPQPGQQIPLQLQMQQIPTQIIQHPQQMLHPHAQLHLPPPIDGYMRPPRHIMQSGIPNVFSPMIVPMYPPEYRPPVADDAKTDIQLSFIDAISKAKQKEIPEEIQVKGGVADSLKKLVIKPTPAREIETPVPIAPKRISPKPTQVKQDHEIANKKVSFKKPAEESSKDRIAPESIPVPTKSTQTIPAFQPYRPRVRSAAQPPSTPAARASPPITPIVVEHRERRPYNILEMMRMRQFPESQVVPVMFKTANINRDKYIKTDQMSQSRDSHYKRSKNGFATGKERLRNMDRNSAHNEMLKIEMQKTINKVTKNTFHLLLKDFIIPEYATEEMSKLLANRMFCAVCTTNACIEEFAKLIIEFNRFYRKTNNDSDFFEKYVIQVFYRGTEIPSSWTAKYNNVKNRKSKNLDELDEINEELQMLERSQRFILNGSIKILGYLMLKSLISVSDGLTMIKNVAARETELDFEMLCVYLTLVMPLCQRTNAINQVVDGIVNNIEGRYKSFPMRLRFMADDLIKLHKANWQSPKITASVTVKNIMKPTTKLDKPDRGETAHKSHTTFTVGAENRYVGLSNKTSMDEGYSHMTKFRGGKYRGTKSESTRPSVPVQEKKLAIDVEAMKSNVLPLLDDFSIDYDWNKLVFELKDMTIANHMDVFVNILFTYLAEKFNVYHVYFGQIFHSCARGDRIKQKDFLKGFGEFMNNFNMLVDDVPMLVKIVSRIITPLIVSNFINIFDYYNILVRIKARNVDQCIVKLVECISECTNRQTATLVARNTKFDVDLNKILLSIKSLSDMPVYSLSVFSLPSEQHYIMAESAQLIDTLSKMTEIADIDNFCVEFTSIIHFCCPTDNEGMESYMSRLTSDFGGVFNVVARDKLFLTKFIESLKSTYDQACKQPLDMFRNLFLCLIKSKVIEFASVKCIVEKFDDEDLNAEMFSLGKSINV